MAKDRIAKSIFRFCRIQTLSRLRGEGMPVLFVNRTTIRAGAGHTGANGNYYLGLHEPHDMAFLLHYLRPDSLFVDAGANVGSYTLLAAGAVGCRAIAFEPAPVAAARLNDNILDNGLDGRIEIRTVCLGEASGSVRFTVNADTMNHIATDASEPAIEVDLRRLDEEIAETPTAIKIDAEGVDDSVLLGAERLLRGCAPMAILIETLGSARSGRSYDEARNWLLDLGFEHVGYDYRSRSLIPAAQSRMNNHLFVRDAANAQMRVRAAPLFTIPGFFQI